MNENNNSTINNLKNNSSAPRSIIVAESGDCCCCSSSSCCCFLVKINKKINVVFSLFPIETHLAKLLHTYSSLSECSHETEIQYLK